MEKNLCITLVIYQEAYLKFLSYFSVFQCTSHQPISAADLS